MGSELLQATTERGLAAAIAQGASRVCRYARDEEVVESGLSRKSSVST